MLALAIGLPVSMLVDDIPKEAPVYLNIPGDLWLRTYAASQEATPPLEGVVQQMFQSFVPDNIAYAVADNQLLAVLVVSIVVGYLVEDESSSILRAAREVERMVTIVVTFIIQCSALGVFSLILSNILKLDPATMGRNLGVLIASTLSSMAIHLFVAVPIIFFALTRMNPYVYWLKNSRAWITAWGSASSAATLSISLDCARDRGISKTVRSFSVPLGCLINMDGTAIYFPIVVVFLARTQGMTLSVVDYVIITAAATLSSIGTTPIPSSSLALSIMIAGLVGVPVTGMMGVVFAIDWLLDRFRTALNVSGDLFGAMVVYKKTGIEDETEDDLVMEGQPMQEEAPRYNRSMA
ncbi:hypothetical protein LLEC1_06749 [Akanthomyces lecanii]|uniref:Amino acid transporter n=1 Tax=Cordyceps confragosa TaxID=2714763 RepID=A0A179I8S4_CORDF|nr:hypothetical protein LLEC1_06749 [Akanthomyces lecanii]